MTEREVESREPIVCTYCHRSIDDEPAYINDYPYHHPALSTGDTCYMLAQRFARGTEPPEREVESREPLEWTREELDGLEVTFSYNNFQSGYWNWLRGQEALRDAVLASQPERVECDEENHRYFREDNGYKFCPDCGQSLKGAGE